MSVITNPSSSLHDSFALIDREVIVRNDGVPMSFADLQNLKATCGATDFFEEPDFGICVLGIESKEQLPADYKSVMIRQFIYEHDEDMTLKISRAKALLSWRKLTHYCGVCGTKLVDSSTLTARECPSCKNLIFPRIEPCIIVLISKGDQILLLRHVQRNQDIYACLAGFMEAGETAEHAVEREVMEETGLKVKNIKYFGSQSWPFPAQLMLAFTAEYESGEIKLQADEISSAKWFSRDDSPAMPPPGSIAYRLIHQC
ncbi:MAG: NAD(+) diphosphatase [Bacteroidales bacterium]|nr:NAD(+) diphosphatase [Bacteroidales bacterium]